MSHEPNHQADHDNYVKSRQKLPLEEQIADANSTIWLLKKLIDEQEGKIVANAAKIEALDQRIKNLIALMKSHIDAV